MACGRPRRSPGRPQWALLSVPPLGLGSRASDFTSGEFFDPWPRLLGLHYHPLPGQHTGLRQQEWRTGRAALSRACLWQARERPRMVFTFSLLSFWWPGRPAVTPLRFVGPRECLHYITPHTTAPKTHTHTGTGSGAHTHSPTRSRRDTPAQSHTLRWQDCCLRAPSAAPTSSPPGEGLPPSLVSGGEFSRLLALKLQWG